MKERSEERVEQPGEKRKARRRGVGDAEVDRHRPASCSGCGAASRPPGGRIQVQGHGTRPRGLQGPREPGGPPQSRDVEVRRYICVVCDVTMSVFPPDVLPRRRYGATAIAYALSLFGLEGAIPPQFVRLVPSATKGRWFLECPLLGTRCDVLYLRGHRFASAKANRLVHRSQRKSS